MISITGSILQRECGANEFVLLGFVTFSENFEPIEGELYPICDWLIKDSPIPGCRVSDVSLGVAEQVEAPLWKAANPVLSVRFNKTEIDGAYVMYGVSNFKLIESNKVHTWVFVKNSDTLVAMPPYEAIPSTYCEAGQSIQGLLTAPVWHLEYPPKERYSLSDKSMRQLEKWDKLNTLKALVGAGSISKNEAISKIKEDLAMIEVVGAYAYDFNNTMFLKYLSRLLTLKKEFKLKVVTSTAEYLEHAKLGELAFEQSLQS